MRSRILEAVLSVALVAWLAAVVVIAVSRTSGHGPRLAGLVSTPDLLAHGHVLTLLSSALPVGRYPFAEIAGLLVAVLCVWRISGVLTVWVVGLAAHIGCTLLAYAGLGAVWLADHGAADTYTDRRDYGISAVWLGLLGYLTTWLWGRNPRAAAVLGGTSVAGSLVLLPSVGGLTTAEHLLAFIIGALMPTWLPGPPAASAPSTNQT